MTDFHERLKSLLEEVQKAMKCGCDYSPDCTCDFARSYDLRDLLLIMLEYKKCLCGILYQSSQDQCPACFLAEKVFFLMERHEKPQKI